MSLPTTRLNAFLPYVLPFVSLCPRPVAELQLRLAAIEFCERTKCWRYITSAQLATNGQALVAPAFTAIHEIEEATLAGESLTPSQFTAVDPNELTGEVQVGKPKYLTQAAHDTVAVYPFAPGLLRLSLFLKPRTGSQFGTDASDPLHDAFNVVPDFMLNQHAEKLAHGALARIFSIKKQPWTDPNEANYYRAKFEEACTGQFATQIKGQQQTRLRTNARWM